MLILWPSSTANRLTIHSPSPNPSGSSGSAIDLVELLEYLVELDGRYADSRVANTIAS